MSEATANVTARLKLISPHFLVPDVVAAAEYYRDTLGFKILGYFLEPPVFAMVARDTVEIHFMKLPEGVQAAPNVSRKAGSLDAYIWTNDLDALFAELQSRGAKVVEAPVVRVYNCYEMVVEDNFGFQLAFAMDYQN